MKVGRPLTRYRLRYGRRVFYRAHSQRPRQRFTSRLSTSGQHTTDILTATSICVVCRGVRAFYCALTSQPCPLVGSSTPRILPSSAYVRSALMPTPLTYPLTHSSKRSLRTLCITITRLPCRTTRRQHLRMALHNTRSRGAIRVRRRYLPRTHNTAATIPSTTAEFSIPYSHRTIRGEP